MHPSMADGKICYIEIPATDIQRSAEFYQKVFGWRIRQRGDGSTSFDDTVGQVSGTWVLGWPPAATPGLLIHIMVENAAKAVEAVVENGCEIVQPVDPNAHEITARFRDPGGNVLGIYQERSLTR